MTTLKTSKLNSQSGFGLIEVMIAVAVISIIALGIGTLVDDMMRAQRKTNVSAAMNSVRELLIASVQDGESWRATAADADVSTGNPDMTCMRPPTGGVCTAGVDYPLNLKNVTGTEAFYSAVATRGVTYEGELCNTYPNGNCRFRWVLTWTATCPSGSSCASPSVAVKGVLEHTPGPLVLPGGFNLKSYEFNIQRGTKAIRNDSLLVANVLTGTAGDLSGSCKSNWLRRQVNTIVKDSGSNVVGIGTDSITLRAGTYNCRVQAPSFRSGSNRLRLQTVTGTGISAQSSVAVASTSGGSANLIIDATLILDQETTFRVEQYCEHNISDFPGSSAAPAWQLGVPARDSSGAYGAVTYTTVACARTS